MAQTADTKTGTQAQTTESDHIPTRPTTAALAGHTDKTGTRKLEPKQGDQTAEDRNQGPVVQCQPSASGPIQNETEQIKITQANRTSETWSEASIKNM